MRIVRSHFAVYHAVISAQWNSLHAVEKRLCRVTEKLNSVCKCEKPISMSSPPHALESGLTTIIIKRDEEEKVLLQFKAD